MRISEETTTPMPHPILSKNGPKCLNCGAKMELHRLSRHTRYSNLSIRSFVCECGTETTDFVRD